MNAPHYTRQELELLKVQVDKAIKVIDSTMEIEYVDPDMMCYHLDAWQAKMNIDMGLKYNTEFIYGIGISDTQMMLKLIDENIFNSTTGVMIAMGLEDEKANHILASFVARNIVMQHIAILNDWKESFNTNRKVGSL